MCLHQLLYISTPGSLPVDMLNLPISFRFFGATLVGDSVLSVANSKKELGLLTGTFLFGLSALELMLHVAGT